MHVLSVDLGTSNTVAVLSAHGRPPRVVDVDGASMMPSAIYLSEDGGGIVVGRDAERRARLDPSRFEPNPKRRIDEGTLLLGSEVVPVTDALAAVLRRVLDETSRQLGGGKPDEVRLTHPAQWGPVRRNTLLSAARQAGAGNRVVLVPEPVAAAAHFASFPGQSLPQGRALAVYDLGAGTFDVAVVGADRSGFSVLAEAGLPDLGGLDVDQALLEHVGRGVSSRDPVRWGRLLRPESTGDRRAQRALREDVRAGKEALSRHPQTEIPLPEPFGDVLVTRVELEGLIRPSLLRSVELLAGTVRSTGLTPDRLAGIYLVGGSSRIPLVATLIAESVRVVPASLDQPETAVALGAHHVPQDGRATRASAPGPQPSATRLPPVSQPVPQQRPQPLPAGPPSGPQQRQPPPPQLPPNPVPMAAPMAMSGVAPVPPPPRPSRSGPSRAWLAVIGLAVVIAVGVLLVVLLTRSGSDTAGGTTLSCTKHNTDSQGFTPCLRQFADTAISDGASCSKAPSSFDQSGTYTVVQCQNSGRTLVWAHFTSVSEMTSQLNRSTTAVTSSNSWSGGGLSGKYYLLQEGTVPTLYATVDNQPVVVIVVYAGGSGSNAASGALADYFNQHVKPR